MSIASSPSSPISINQLVLLAYKRAGILPVEARLSGANMAPKLEHGRQLLDLILDGLATDGFTARTTLFYDLPLVAGESQYTLPDHILDVIDDAMFVGSENPDTKYTSGELVCSQVPLSTWQTLTVKGSSSTRPQLYTVERSGADVVLKFWPVPSEAGTMRLKTMRLLGSNTADGDNSVDLQRYWYDALVWCLAYYVAVDSSMPADRVGMLMTTAELKKKAALRFSFERPGIQAVVSYPTQWSS